MSIRPQMTIRDGKGSPMPSHQAPLLKEQAYAEIKTLLLDGIYAPGAFLSERRLAAQLGMSKTPIRAALERLELESFVATAPRQGIVVRELSLQEIKDHYEIRTALEGFVVGQLAGRLTEPQLAALRDNLAQQQDQLDGGAARTYMQLDAVFHLSLCDFLGNQEISRVMRHQRDKLYRVVLKILERDIHRMARSHAEHVAIVDALEAGAPDQAASLMREHFENGKRLLLAT